MKTRSTLFALAALTLGMLGSACDNHQGAPGTQVNEALSENDRVPGGGMEKRRSDSSAAVTPTATPTPGSAP